MWSSRQLKFGQFGSLKKYQKVNQFPRSFELTRKDLLVESIQRNQEIHGHRQFDFLPLTLTLPRELPRLRDLMMANPNQYWIFKPSGGSQGKGIYITNDFREATSGIQKDREQG